MDDFISRNALLDDLKWLKSVVNESSKNEVQDFIDRVEAFPKVDAREVVHGRWIHRPDKRICPFCNYRYSHFGGKDLNYCPNCGAKMDGE